jgi:hypothetical protein
MATDVLVWDRHMPMDFDDFRGLPPGGTLLEHDAALHIALAEDRDADCEAAALAHLVGHRRQLRTLELLAGGGYHGRALARVGHDSHYLDCSPAMRDRAVTHLGVPEDHYHLGRLPELPASVRAAAPYDLVVLARFSLGYFPPRQVQRIACGLRTLMRPGAIWAIELQDLISVANDHRDLNIRVRKAIVDGRTATLEFPDANVLVVPGECGEPPVLWQSYTLTVESEAGREQTRYGHRELLYDPDYLKQQLPAIAGNFTRIRTPELDAAFPQSTLLALRALP